MRINELLFLYFMGLLDLNNLIAALNEIKQRQNQPFLVGNGEPWTINAEEDGNFVHLFRFSKIQILELSAMLGLSPIITLENGCKIPKETALCMV